MEERLCTECKKKGLDVVIGGLNHRLREDNKRRFLNLLSTSVYFTFRGNPVQTGYQFGQPVESPALPERSMSPAVCTIVKLLIHSALVWACCVNFKKADVNQIVVSDIKEDDLPMFFWNHLVINCKSLQNHLSMGLDDVALLIHLIISKVLTTAPLENGEFFKDLHISVYCIIYRLCV